MPVDLADTLWRSPNLFPVTGQRYTVGWQNAKKGGPCFPVARHGVLDDKIVDRFPLTQDGWSRTWAALVKLDAGAAQAVARTLQERRTTHNTQSAETERQAQVYEAFTTAGEPTVFRALGVQVLAAENSVYTIGYSNAATKTNTSRLLGSLAGAQAVVTDGSQAWSPGRAIFLPIGLAGLATKTKADAVVVFADGIVHSVALDGNNVVRA